jgi:hypothetical protein
VIARRLGAIVFAATMLAGCGESVQIGHSEVAPPLRITRLQGAVVRVGKLRGEPLYGLRLRAFVCSRSAAQADRTIATSFRVAHYVTRGRAATRWPKAFRVLENELHWLVPLGETSRGPCRSVDFEDVIPPPEYGGLESPLGCLGYCARSRCYGVQLTLRALLLNRGDTTVSASRRAIVQCGRFRKPA